jgi:hypothetical protein
VSTGLPLAIALVCRILSAVFIDTSILSPAPGQPGLLMEYGVIAKNLLHGYGFAYSWIAPSGTVITMPTTYMPPGQAWIDYMGLGLFGDSAVGVYAIFASNIILGVLAVYLIGTFTYDLFGSKQLQRIALWVVALYPPLIYSTATFGVTTPVIVINLLILIGCVRFVKASTNGINTIRYGWMIGAGFGLQFFFRGEAPVFLAVTIIALAWTLRERLRVLLPTFIIIAVLPFVIIAPWTIRNYITFDRFVLISSNGGFNFWRGNNPYTTGSPWTESGGAIWATDSQWTYLQSFMGKPAEFERAGSTMFYGDAFSWMRTNPTDATLLVMKKGLIFWTFDIRSKMGGTIQYMSIYAVTLALFILGLIRIRRDHVMSFGIRLMLLWAGVSTVIAMIFFPLPRFQLLMIAGYFPIVVYGISYLIRRFDRPKEIV